MPKVLFISRHIPYRANSGITVKIKNLLACLSRVSDVVCVFIVDKEEGNQPALSDCNDLQVTNYLIESKKKPFGVTRYLVHLLELFTISANVKKTLSGIMEKENPDIVWLEFGYIGHFVPFMRKYGVPVVYGSHNSQFKLDYWLWRSNGNIVYRLKMAPFVLFYLLHEKLFFRLPDRFFCISRQDLSYYAKFIPSAKLRLLPFFFDEGDLANINPFITDQPYVCMVGSLRSYQNYAAAIFTLENIWPILQKKNPHLHLYVIGEQPVEGSPESMRLKQCLASSERVILTGCVDSVIPLVKGALVNMVPLSIGSGVRTKIIESAACGTPVVSTSIGAEGLPFVTGESIAIADTAEGLAEQVQQLLNDGGLRGIMAEKAYMKYKEELSCDAGMRKIKNIFHELNLDNP